MSRKHFCTSRQRINTLKQIIQRAVVHSSQFGLDSIYPRALVQLNNWHLSADYQIRLGVSVCPIGTAVRNGNGTTVHLPPNSEWQYEKYPLFARAASQWRQRVSRTVDLIAVSGCGNAAPEAAAAARRQLPDWSERTERLFSTIVRFYECNSCAVAFESFSNAIRRLPGPLRISLVSRGGARITDSLMLRGSILNAT